MRFRYVDRHQKDTLVLAPGWASDWRIFSLLNLEFNYLFPVQFSPFTFNEDLLRVLEEKNIKKISLLGWSLGGFVCAGFAAQYAGLIKELILISIREKYTGGEVADVRSHLKKNRQACLSWFYGRCFPEGRTALLFKNRLLKDYNEYLSTDYLLDGLDYLERARIDSAALRGFKKIRIIHGERDRIAPISEAMSIRGSLPRAEFIPIAGAGHIPFWQEGFEQYVVLKANKAERDERRK